MVSIEADVEIQTLRPVLTPPPSLMPPRDFTSFQEKVKSPEQPACPVSSILAPPSLTTHQYTALPVRLLDGDVFMNVARHENDTDVVLRDEAALSRSSSSPTRRHGNPNIGVTPWSEP